MVVTKEFLGPLVVANWCEALYYTWVLRIRLQGKPLQSSVGALAPVLALIMFGGFWGLLSRPMELLSDPTLVGTCPLYGIWVGTAFSIEMGVSICGSALALVRLLWLIEQGRDPSTVWRDVRPFILVWAVFFSAPITPFSYLKSCDADGIKLWSVMELLTLGVAISPQVICLLVTVMLARRIAAGASASKTGMEELDRSHRGQFYKDLLHTATLMAVFGIVIFGVLGVGVMLQLVMLLTPYLQYLHGLVDCLACFIAWTFWTLGRVSTVELITRRSSDARRVFQRLAKSVDGGALAALLRDDSTTPGQAANEGMALCRAVRLSDLGPATFKPPPAKQHSAFSGGATGIKDKGGTFACDAPDFFVSHSWRDDPEEKYRALQRVVADFEAVHGREPVFWIDAYCIDQDQIESSLKYLPVFVACCDRVLVLYGASYFSRLWCVWELFVVGAVSNFSSIIFWAIEPRQLRDMGQETASFRVHEAGCYTPADKERIQGVVNLFEGGVHGFEEKIAALGANVIASEVDAADSLRSLLLSGGGGSAFAHVSAHEPDSPKNARWSMTREGSSKLASISSRSLV